MACAGYDEAPTGSTIVKIDAQLRQLGGVPSERHLRRVGRGGRRVGPPIMVSLIKAALDNSVDERLCHLV